MLRHGRPDDDVAWAQGLIDRAGRAREEEGRWIEVRDQHRGDDCRVDLAGAGAADYDLPAIQRADVEHETADDDFAAVREPLLHGRHFASDAQHAGDRLSRCPSRDDHEQDERKRRRKLPVHAAHAKQEGGESKAHSLDYTDGRSPP